MKKLFDVLQAVVGAGITNFQWQKGRGNYLAVSGGNHQVTIYGRQGDQVAVIHLPGTCTWLDWDKDGEILAITQDFNGILYLWNANTSETVKFDTGMKEGLCISLWTCHSLLLAIGTLKGNLVLYNYRNRKKVPVLGKHSRKIHSGTWSINNVLALAGDDKCITLSDKEGNTISQSDVKFDITKGSLSFSPNGSRLSLISGHKLLYIFAIDEETDTSPFQLIFQARYGELCSQAWVDDNQIMLGFSKGFMIMVSRETGSIGEEVFQTREFKDHLSDISISPQLPIIAAVGENEVKLHEFQDLKEVYGSYTIEDTNSVLSKAQWTDDGQLLSVSVKNGGLLTFLIQMPQLGYSCDTKVAYLTSLLQVTVINDVDKEPPLVIECPIEPSFLTIGPNHLAIGMNNRVWFSNLQNESVSKKVFNERSYVGTISDMCINGTYCAVLSNGDIELHQIDSKQFNIGGSSKDDGKPEERSFPDEGQNETITTHCLTTDYLIYGTESGSIVYFYLEDWQYVCEFKHVLGISKLYSNPSGSRVVFCDDKSDCFIYNPVNDLIIDVPDYPPSALGLLWDMAQSEKHVFIIFDKEKVFTYVYYRDTAEGPKCVLLECTDLPHGHKPLLLYSGEVTCLNLMGKTKTVKLQSHNYSDEQELSEDQLNESFKKSLALCHLKDGWLFASAIDKKVVWDELANTALYHLDVPLAIRAFQQTSNLSMVTSLQEILDVEDRNLLVGYINMYQENYNVAQDLFLKSCEPKTALEMRCDLLQWNQALELAKTLSEDRIPFICRQYAEQLEFVGDYGNSLIHYERAVTNQPALMEHDERCVAGLARTALHTGDVRRGVKLAQSSRSSSLKLECAEILETFKLYAEAGVLYEQAENWEKSAQCYMKTKNWDKVGAFLSKIPLSVRLHSHYAKAREIDGHFKESAKAYESAQEYDNAIRVYLDHLHQPEEAVRVANDSKSIEGAKLVANFFQKTGDFSSALQFLVMSKCNDEAYYMAESHNQMDQYGSVIGDSGSTEDYLRIANYYQTNREHFKAGAFFMKATEYSRSIDHLLQCSSSLYPDGDHINLAIKVVGLAKKESLIQRLHNYLMGEVDGEPKDAKFLFGMYLSLGQYREASQTAILIAKEDQNAGNYRSARNLLFQMYKDLNAEGIKIPNEMKQNLMLLHSYVLAKIQVKRGDHENAARLLIRVATNISKFPSHVVPILTSTVIECQRSGLKKSSFEFAAMLMRPEYRQQIDSKWKKKIEAIVRKPERSEVEDSLQQCPYCQFMLPSMRLDCPQCKNNLPFCILTGKHMVKSNWTECQHCKFPALYSDFKSLIEAGEPCPLCGNGISLENTKLFSEKEVQPKLLNMK